jgi:hypothetical protein
LISSPLLWLFRQLTGEEKKGEVEEIGLFSDSEPPPLRAE